ncbi:hypothetical protein MtrunA17_Chr5g0394331 [Medicago truncatula]|uniref:Thionin-like protein n=1 Tax=Medicago truncatula TaxID=3880 RepID=G7K2C3_MEDTR|nr:hypothetical protein MTR_5g006050 [Medicago truncatula]RHN53295.1 hypothetical protein MtrunA17_Chr5g0394331 [Medicago truncatula]
MGNKIVALLLLVCLVVVGNVEGGSYPEEECFNNCHRELDEKYSVMYVNATCMFRCVKWTASKTEVKSGSRKNGPLETPTVNPNSRSITN